MPTSRAHYIGSNKCCQGHPRGLVALGGRRCCSRRPRSPRPVAAATAKSSPRLLPRQLFHSCSQCGMPPPCHSFNAFFIVIESGFDCDAAGRARGHRGGEPILDGRHDVPPRPVTVLVVLQVERAWELGRQLPLEPVLVAAGWDRLRVAGEDYLLVVDRCREVRARVGQRAPRWMHAGLGVVVGVVVVVVGRVGVVVVRVSSAQLTTPTILLYLPTDLGYPLPTVMQHSIDSTHGGGRCARSSTSSRGGSPLRPAAAAERGHWPPRAVRQHVMPCPRCVRCLIAEWLLRKPNRCAPPTQSFRSPSG